MTHIGWPEMVTRFFCVWNWAEKNFHDLTTPGARLEAGGQAMLDPIII